jgi:prophage antirepressor-like protein
MIDSKSTVSTYINESTGTRIDFNLKTIIINNTTLWIGIDELAPALNYQQDIYSAAIEFVNIRDIKCYNDIITSVKPNISSRGRPRKITRKRRHCSSRKKLFVNIDGLFALISNSSLENIDEIKMWLTDTVIAELCNSSPSPTQQPSPIHIDTEIVNNFGEERLNDERRTVELKQMADDYAMKLKNLHDDFQLRLNSKDQMITWLQNNLQIKESSSESILKLSTEVIDANSTLLKILQRKPYEFMIDEDNIINESEKTREAIKNQLELHHIEIKKLVEMLWVNVATSNLPSTDVLPTYKRKHFKQSLRVMYSAVSKTIYFFFDFDGADIEFEQRIIQSNPDLVWKCTFACDNVYTAMENVHNLIRKRYETETVGPMPLINIQNRSISIDDLCTFDFELLHMLNE